MELTRYVDDLQRQLATAAGAGGDEARELAERLTAPLEAAARLVLL
ncbi:histidine kinase, partial [Kineococcus sp. T90]|nr:histidine kinase [Kineococcus indalonis]